VTDKTSSIPAALRIPLAVDIAVVASVIFGGGIMWQKVDALSHDLAALRQQLTVSREQGDTGRTATVDRLARLETEVRMTREDVAEIKTLLRERRP
jgi:ribosomal protein L29